jgi:hypothetical protein
MQLQKVACEQYHKCSEEYYGVVRSNIDYKVNKSKVLSYVVILCIPYNL